MKIFVNVARLEIGQLFIQGARWRHPDTLDTFLVYSFLNNIRNKSPKNDVHVKPGTTEKCKLSDITTGGHQSVLNTSKRYPKIQR